MPRLASPVFAVLALSACAGSTDTTSRKPDGGSSTLVTDVRLYATTEPDWNQELYWAVAELNGHGLPDIVGTAWPHNPADWGRRPPKPPMPVEVLVQPADGG